MEPRNRQNFYAVTGILLVWMGLETSARSETVQGNIGFEQTTVVSSIYQTTPITTLQAEATYTRPFAGRFSAFAQYQTNIKNTFSAGVGGLAYDSEDLRTKGGAIRNDGTAEITRVPVWLFRSSLGLGLFKYVDILRSNNALLGSNNAVPVQADLYGLKFAATLIRFLNDDWGLVAAGSYVVASAENFGVSSTCLSFGLLYRNN